MTLPVGHVRWKSIADSAEAWARQYERQLEQLMRALQEERAKNKRLREPTLEQVMRATQVLRESTAKHGYIISPFEVERALRAAREEGE